jgi:Ca-activated chloride channel family protein
MKTHGIITTGKKVLITAVTIAAIGMSAGKSTASGLLIADGGFGGVLEIVEHDVKVTINNGIAVTKVTQVFKNTEKRQVEALYTFPVPKGASVANFSMWINGKEMIGEVLEKKKAREIYNSYKRKKRDPGLLEQVDYKTFEMRIFPIAAGAEQKVEITYYQEMDFDHDWVNYVYPLATTTRAGLDAKTKGKFAITFDIKSEVPIKQLESPSHNGDFVIISHSKSYAQASLETEGGDLNRDVVLACEMKRPRSGIDMITSKESGEDGYFCMTITAGEDLGKLNAGMDYIFLIDISGSMGNDSKLAISKKSVESFVEALDKNDRFDVMTFNIKPNVHFGSLQNATAENITGAVNFMSSQKAKGGTVLDPAMAVAYKYAAPDRTLNVVILSDGMTEQRERRILLDRIKSRPRNARVFCIGVGNDVNRQLLQQIAEDSGGIASFVSRGSNFTRLAEAFRRKLMHPVASDIDITFSGIKVYDIEPKILPNLYYGAPVRIYGRYKGNGKAKVKMIGDIKGVTLAKSKSFNFPAKNNDNPEIERMWAWKRIDGLLKMADRSGNRNAVADQVVALGEMYSIVTEYTSFLVLENDNEYKRWKIKRLNQRRITRDRTAQEKLRDSLDEIRRMASTDIGPQEKNATEPIQQIANNTPTTQNPQFSQPQQTSRNSNRSSRRSRGLRMPSPGTGPVGIVFLGAAAWLNRRKKKVA